MTKQPAPRDAIDDPWDRVIWAGAAFGLVLASGTVAFRLLGLPWIDAFYQTLVTVSTVGFTEIGPEYGVEITQSYRIVSSLLILIGVGVGLYSIGLFFEALMEGRLTDHVGRSRMRKEIDHLAGHIIVCGWGQVGRAIAASLVASGQPVVVVDRRPEASSQAGPLDARLVVTGEATDDEVLKSAGIERARSLVVALDGEPDNLFVTLSGRALNPSLFIVTRAVGPSATPKLLQAGADRVVNPHQIGASRMASFVVQPNVADFLGETMTDHNLEVRLGEIEIGPRSGLADQSLAESEFLSASGLTLLAVRRPNGSFEHRRDDAWVPLTGDVLIVLGTSDQHRAGTDWLARR
ncbi:MAG: voltage-gated potassium channel [Acidimicrobiales bacterium]|jgi:voltage-gated potassium channel